MDLTWKQANEVAAKASDQALGINPPRGRITVTADEVRQVAERAAVVALRMAGCLAKDDAAARRANDRIAEEATRRENAYKARHGGVMA